MEKLNTYRELLSKSYEEAVNILLEKYGPSTDDYFRESSYEKFLRGENKSIAKGKYARTKEGLYCHHIDEDKHLKLADNQYIRKYEYPFELQKKDRLVYCDLFEHAILHALIAKETDFQLGFPGYTHHILPNIEDWFLRKEIPRVEWRKNCYDKAYLSPEDTFKLIGEINKLLGKEADRFSKDHLSFYLELKSILNFPESLEEYYKLG